MNLFACLQLEMSLMPLYQGETTMLDMIKLLEKSGFMLYGIEPGFYDVDKGQLLQVDGIFLNKKLLNV